MQLMSTSGRVESRQQEVSKISRDLKALAKELQVPVVALSQLACTGGPQSSKTADVRPSRVGSIEQDADVVAFIYREDYYHETDENKGMAELLIAKQRKRPDRNGPTCFPERIHAI